MAQVPAPLLQAVSVRAPDQIGRVFRRWRKARKLTQAQLAKKAGLSQKTISTIENGIKTAEFDTLLSICAALDLEFVVRERPQTIASSARLSELFGNK
jgi:HTH-type transcriptional regulator/antitoxin HipB